MRSDKTLWGRSISKITGSSGATKSLRDVGDQLRDSGMKIEAAEAYGEHLVREPNDFEIWVQRGNCLKDVGQHADAIMAYERALSLRPDDADVFLQMGHAYKLSGNRQKAAKAYEEALQREPSLNSAASELRGLGVRPPLRRSPLDEMHAAGRSATVVDITDLLSFLSVHTRVTGIQRVQACILTELFRTSGSSGGFTVGDHIIVFCDNTERAIYAISASRVAHLLETLAGKNAVEGDIRAALSQVFDSKIKVSPKSGDCYLILGAFWIVQNYARQLLALKRRGVRIGLYAYDLIPITHPQFVTDSTRQGVVDQFAEVMLLIDFVLTISEYVAREVGTFVSAQLGRDLPIRAVPLAHELPAPPADEHDTLGSDFLDQIPLEFVLCVCTLEGRKNHQLLLSIWKSLAQKLGDRCPSLVLVGRWGWRIEEFQKELFESNFLDGKVVIFHELSDFELAHLYKNCMFTIFPSFVEGWGLPVGESLAYGKPCIASNTSSIPEVGGDFCRYIDPHNAVGAFQVVERTLLNRADLATWTTRIAQEFKARSWADVTADFFNKARMLTASLPAEIEPVMTLTDRRVYELTASSVLGQAGNWRDRAVAFVLAENWHDIEEWGTWSNKRNATLSFGTTCKAGERIRVLLRLRLPPPTDTGAVNLTDGTSIKNVRLTALPQWVAFEATVKENCRCDIIIQRVGQVVHLQPARELFFGIDALAYHKSDDIIGRLDVLEAILSPGKPLVK
jgi:glycosyltransferase involved in cell wall biosynthesis